MYPFLSYLLLFCFCVNVCSFKGAYYSLECKVLQKEMIGKNPCYDDKEKATPPTYCSTSIFSQKSPSFVRDLFYGPHLTTSGYIGGIFSGRGNVQDKSNLEKTTTAFNHSFKKEFEDNQTDLQNTNQVEDTLKTMFHNVYTKEKQKNDIDALVFYIHNNTTLYIASYGQNKAIWGIDENKRTKQNLEKETINNHTYEPEITVVPLSAGLTIFASNRIDDTLIGLESLIISAKWLFCEKKESFARLINKLTACILMISFNSQNYADYVLTRSFTCDPMSNEYITNAVMKQSDAETKKYITNVYSEQFPSYAAFLLMRISESNRTKQVYVCRGLLFSIAFCFAVYWYNKK